MICKTLFALTLAGCLLAQAPSKHQLNTELIRTGLYVIHGPSGNTLLRLSADGVLLVDAQPAANLAELTAKVSKISGQPIRMLILTHDDLANRDSYAAFRDRGAQIVAQSNLAKHLSVPAFSFDNDYNLHGGSIEVRLLNLGGTVVYFPDQKVVAIGDLSPSAALAQILSLDFDLAIPTHGPALTRSELETLIKKFE